MQIIEKDDQEILNACTKYLARGNRYIDAPPNPQNPNLTRVSEAWRFPIIESYGGADATAGNNYTHNEVTFVYCTPDAESVQPVAVIGTFAPLYEALPLQPVRFLGEPTGYLALTVVLPVGQSHRYLFTVDGQRLLDPVNPQQVTLSNGQTWSRFFTDFYRQPTEFEDWELRLLQRLTEHILPFRTEDAERFLLESYNYLNLNQKQTMRVYDMDVAVGAANFIDNIVAREERHHLIDYKICLEQIDRVLRQRNPYVESWEVSEQLILALYNDMANNSVNGWDYSQYTNPRYFLELLRRHTISGAFSHPKYGGNVDGIGWAYLAERYTDNKTGATLFDWPAALERPLGNNQDYTG
jgi:hypothetical protein